VFSTLHTNNAAGSFPRLIDLGIDEKVLSSSINAALAQRLVRKLCSSCQVTRDATAEEKKIIDSTLAGITNKALIPQNTTAVHDAKEGGCAECHGRGYRGRIGIFEAIFMDTAIEEILRTSPSEREIAQAAKAQGIPTMQEDGVLKVLRGVTSLDELARVIDFDVA